MKSIIQELQFEAIKQNGSITELLRKSKIVASKLDLQEFLTWINNELNGYMGIDYKRIPAYRLINGEPKGWNPYHGWISVTFNDNESQEILSQMPINQPIGELENLHNSNLNNLRVSYPPEAQKTIGEAVGSQTQFVLMVGKSSVAGVLDAVRNIILDWSIKLEKEGILGEGISFSKEDKEKAHRPNTVIKIDKIDNFVGNVGNVADNASINISNVTQNEVAAIKDLIKQISKNIKEAGLKDKDQLQIKTETKYIEAEIIKKEPQKIKINKYFSTIKQIFEGASGNLIAQGILYGINNIFKG